ncbi:hypothetical protein IFM89_007072 [Coptis chinensis]|uniref:RRM domain-containing protein n=1 Tax=Coptis chinensis TaxID=261450 RepID=A0A835LYU0_9MAGN|nr:hypothetical protein IFM89_007072 [Coptis chinensis]
MGAKAKKATMRKNAKKKASSISLASARKNNESSADFLPLEGGPARKLPNQPEQSVNIATVLYIGRIPHGFYETEMREFFKQFGDIKNLRIARSKKTGKSKHFGFIEFVSPEVAKIVADCMHNYLLFEHMVQVHLIPPERVHPKLWKGVNRIRAPPNWTEITRKQHNKERTVEEHRKLVEGVVKRDQKRRKKIEAAGFDYVPPEIVGGTQPAPKKIKFDED